MVRRILRAVFGPDLIAQSTVACAIYEDQRRGRAVSDAERRFLAEWEARVEREAGKRERAARLQVNRWWSS